MFTLSRMNSLRLVLIILAIFADLTVNSRAGESLVYFGTYTGAKSQGIYVSRFDSVTGKLSAPELAAKTKNPTFLAIAPGGNFLYAVSEVDQIDGKRTGAVDAFALDAKTGKLTPLNQQNSGGSGPCHVAVDATDKCLLVANYGGGSIAALPIHADGSLGEAATTMQHTGSSVNTNRQAGPHAHFILPSPDNRFTLDCDLGLDKIFINHLDAPAAKLTPNEPAFTTVDPGSGPRHLLFSLDGKFVYVINEMAGTITVFSYTAENAAMTASADHFHIARGFFRQQHRRRNRPASVGQISLRARIAGTTASPFLRWIRQTGKLTFVEHQSTMGRTPRHFAIDPTGRWLLAENQGSDLVVVFAIDPDTGKLKPTGQSISVGSPVCAVFVAEK